ncbi:hypothetical protein R1sor_027223 [Riccia sorocarpa]|uniref:Endonuclease/exonuclease/phosphatase domain-containing protein n=1 Tax=Riccia sorocarpa TaxID=122646 RepID=A0ABD3GGW4_9MARC
MASASVVTEECDIPATKIGAERLYSILLEAGVVREPLPRIDDYAEQTGLTWELNTVGAWCKEKVELVRAPDSDRKKYFIQRVDLCKGSERPVFAHHLWNGKLAPAHTGVWRRSLTLMESTRPHSLLKPPSVMEGDPSVLRMVKQLETMNGLVVSLLGEVSQVKRAFTDLQGDFRKLRQHSEEQALEIKQLKIVCEEMKNNQQKLLSLDGSIASLTDLVETRSADQLSQLSSCCTKLDALKPVECSTSVVGGQPLDFREALGKFEEKLKVYTSDAKRDADWGHSLWDNADVIILTETWEYRGAEGLEIPGFSRVITVWNEKKGGKGRGYGGIALWTRDGLGLRIKIEAEDKNNQYVCVRFIDGIRPSFLIAAYFAPQGAPIYSQTGNDDVFLGLYEVLTAVREEGPVWVLGDFNNRVGSEQSTVVTAGEIWRSMNTSKYVRVSEDGIRNGRAGQFIRFISACGLHILNDKNRRHVYEQELQRRIREERLDGTADLTQLMCRVARQVFSRGSADRESWFDQDCAEARKQVLKSVKEDRGDAKAGGDHMRFFQ